LGRKEQALLRLLIFTFFQSSRGRGAEGGRKEGDEHPGSLSFPFSLPEKRESHPSCICFFSFGRAGACRRGESPRKKKKKGGERDRVRCAHPFLCPPAQSQAGEKGEDADFLEGMRKEERETLLLYPLWGRRKMERGVGPPRTLFSTGS